MIERSARLVIPSALLRESHGFYRSKAILFHFIPFLLFITILSPFDFNPLSCTHILPFSFFLSYSNKHTRVHTLHRQLPLRIRQRRLHINGSIPRPLNHQFLPFTPFSTPTFVTSCTIPSFSHLRSLAAS